MAGAALAFTLGIVCLHAFATLPAPWWGVLSVPALGALSGGRPWCWAGAAGLGFCWALWVANAALSERLPASLDGISAQVTGTVVSLPEAGERVLRFNLDVEKIVSGARELSGPDQVRLSWYDEFPRVQPGERWRLPVKLSTPHGYFNPGGFDYEGWLFREGIDATGYVTGEAIKLGDSGWEATTTRWRSGIAGAMDALLPQGPPAALLIALAVADTRGITDAMWQTLNATGTSHLIAISGMHIALVTGFGLLLGTGLARLFPSLLRRLPARHWGALFGLACGFAYAALAGFVLPTRRALVMVAVFLIALLLRRNLSPVQGISLALLAVLILDPLAPLSPGFWLSFLAVAVLIAAFSGRARMSWWRSLTRAQWMVSLALLPVVVLFFQRISWIGPLANLIAIPLVELFAVPCVLLGLLFLPIPGPVAGGCLQLAHGLLALFWQFVSRLAAQPASSAAIPVPDTWVLIAALAGCLWLLSPRGVPGRLLGVALLAPLLLGLTMQGETSRGAFDVSVLDVGQGLAVVIETQNHVLVYDAGPGFPSGFDTGSAVVVPYLRASRAGEVSALIVSHGDNDHAGGVSGLVETFAPDLWLSSDPDRPAPALPCRAGRGWRWDGVHFDVLHPPPGLPYQGNNSSCVVRIASPAGAVLLTGDIEAVVERRLVATAELSADVLIAPHHGSKSSSSKAFIAAVRPEWVVYSAGFNNRFGQPAAGVRARYRAAGARAVNTAYAGMVQFRLRPGKEPALTRYRVEAGHYWNPKPEELVP